MRRKADLDSNQAVLNGDTIFRDGDTLFAQNAQREMIAHPIVDMTTEIDIPGTSTRVNITGTVEQVIAYINDHFPNYVWPDDDELDNTAAAKVTAEDNQVFCDVFKQGSYYVAKRVIKHLRHWKRHKINLGPGPAACTEVSCRIDAYKQTMAIWFCNDVSVSLRSSYVCALHGCSHFMGVRIRWLQFVC